jgi:ParB/RepB/Spo0J family partition protein
MTNATREPKTISDFVRVDRLRANPWNKARPIDAEFTASIQDRGVLSPLRVREVEADFKGRDLEIICGERRWRAAMEAGFEHVPAVILESTDEEAQKDTLVENTHRVGFSPWQEAELVGDLLGKDMDPEAIAAATGWSVATVRRRAKLLQVSPAWREVLEMGGFPSWTIQHFEVLASFDERFQENLWKRIQYRASGMTVADLKEEISGESQALKNAPWDLEDVALMPRAGACVGCEKRSDAQADLFGDASGASCLDGSCFASKLKAFGKRKEAELLEKHPEAVKVTDSYSGGAKDLLRPGSYTEAKKSDKGAVPAIVHGGNGKVTLAYVKVKKEAKAPTEKDLAKEAARKKEARITALAIEKLIAIVQDPDAKFHDDARDVLVQFCLVYGGTLDIEEDDRPMRVRAFAKKPATVAELWEAALPELDRQLNRAKWALENGWRDGDENPTVAMVAWLVEADFAELLAEAKAELETAPAPSEEGAVPGTVQIDDEDNFHGMPED